MRCKNDQRGIQCANLRKVCLSLADTWLRPALVFLVCAQLSLLAGAEDYPDRTVKVIVPFPAGRTADAAAPDRVRLVVSQMGPSGHYR
jgi:hypothetical protein